VVCNGVLGELDHHLSSSTELDEFSHGFPNGQPSIGWQSAVANQFQGALTRTSLRAVSVPPVAITSYPAMAGWGGTQFGKCRNGAEPPQPGVAPAVNEPHHEGF
jgi:hypothetical protein